MPRTTSTSIVRRSWHGSLTAASTCRTATPTRASSSSTRTASTSTAWGERGTPPNETRPNYFNNVHGVTVDPATRQVYVNDRGNLRIQVFDENGKFLRMFKVAAGANLHFVHIDADRRLWVFDNVSQKLAQYDLEGRLVYAWGSLGSFPGALWGVHGISVDQEQNLYLAAVGRGGVQKFRPRSRREPGVPGGQARVLRVEMIGALRTSGSRRSSSSRVMAGGGDAQQPASVFDRYFTDKTMRVDYFHSGGMGQEIVALERIVADGPWPGSRTRLVDDTNLGKYLFEVIDRDDQRGDLFARLRDRFTGNGKRRRSTARSHRTFPESLRLPWPKAPVQVVLKKRDAQNSFRELWSTVVDPESRFVNPADTPAAGKVWTVFENGPAVGQSRSARHQ